METVFAYPQKTYSKPQTRLFGNPGETLGSITIDNFPPLEEIRGVPGWLVPSSSSTAHGTLHTITSASGSAVPYEFITQERTEVIFRDYEFELLVEASRMQDERRFCEIAGEINWDSRSPEYFIAAIFLSSAAGANTQAIHLAHLGARQYPDNIELQKFAHILAPARVKPNNQPPQPEGTKDIQWLKDHRQEYSGEWVALLRGELLGSAPTLKGLIQKVGNPKDTQILVTQVY